MEENGERGLIRPRMTSCSPNSLISTNCFARDSGLLLANSVGEGPRFSRSSSGSILDPVKAIYGGSGEPKCFASWLGGGRGD